MPSQRPRCPVCRSKRWHRDKASGLVVCEEGHVLQGYVQEDNEADPTTAAVTRKRYVRKNKQRRERSTRNPDLFHGPQLRFLYFQCAQLVLRHQIRALIIHWGLPPELETIARDLWAMYISLTDLESEPFKHLEDQTVKPGIPDQKAEADTATEDLLQKYYDNLSDDDDEQEPPEPTIELDPDEDQEADEQPSKPDPPSAQSRTKRRKPAKPDEAFNPAKRLRLQYTLAICYLSCLTLRVPIFMKDLLDLASSYKISYLEPMKVIPADMRKHIGGFGSHRDFVHSHVLPVVGVRSAGQAMDSSFVHVVAAFARMLHTSYGVDFPDVNPAPMLWKSVKVLSLPPWFYVSCRRILIRIDAPMSIPYRPEDRRTRFTIGYADALLAASIVISCKLLWGLDGKSRIPVDAGDIATAMPRLDAWLEKAEELILQHPPTLQIKALRTDDVGSLDDADVDDFLDLFEDNLLALDGQGVRPLGTLALKETQGSVADRFFPLPARAPASIRPASTYNVGSSVKFEASLRSFYSEIHPPLPGEAVDDEPLFPGQKYTLHPFGDQQGVFPRDLARVLALVSEVTGLPTDEIARTVRRTEIQLARAVTGAQAGSVLHGLQNALPVEGFEARSFGADRLKGGAIPRPPTLVEGYRRREDEKEPAVLMPKVVKRK